jgi:PAS domain S-box-containing protein
MVMDWQGLLGLIGTLGAAVVGLGVLWGLIKTLHGKVEGMLGIGELKTDLKLVAERIDFLVAEFMPNSGSSMKDQLNRLETDLALANERQRARMLDTPEMIFETDKDGHCVWVNRTYSKAVQMAISELVGHGWVNGIAVKDRERVVAEWYLAVKEDREFEIEFDFQDADGNHFPVMCRSYKMRDWRTGEAVGYLGRCDKI